MTLLAPAGSRVPEAELVPLDPSEILQAGFDLTPLLPASVEILHAHGPVRVPPDHPHVFTLHGNLRSGRGPPPNTIFVSADHARRHGGTAFVYNGVDPSEFVFRPEKADYDLFLGRLHTVKGYRWAIQGAKRSGQPIVVAGGWRPSLSRRVRFVGSVDGDRKAGLLAGARCLWMPALWDEPFGLTLVEAMMSGTPVLGTRRGALPEVVSNEVGALGDTLDELVALRSVNRAMRSARLPPPGGALVQPHDHGGGVRAHVSPLFNGESASRRSTRPYCAVTAGSSLRN